MSELSLGKSVAATASVMVHFKVPGLASFCLELQHDQLTVRDVKKLAKEECDIEPEHMRFVYNSKQLKDTDTLECYDPQGEAPIQLLFTAGHLAMIGGGGGTGGGRRAGVGPQRNPFTTPVRGLPGSKALRSSRMSGRPGGMGLIRKYGILMKRQEFREKAEEIGFVKYR